MAEGLDLKNVVKHLANGSLGDNLCLVCLLPLSEDNCENIFTLICTEDDEYCIANVLREVCQIKILDSEHYNVCLNCFTSATETYKFFIKAKRSFEILNYYTDQLSKNIQDLEINEEDGKRLLCIPLPTYTPDTPELGIEFDGIGTRNIEDIDGPTESTDLEIMPEEDVIMIVEDGETIMYRLNKSILHKLDSDSEDENVLMIVNEKKRKKRGPMVYIQCTHCPVKYRFLSKLKDHMKGVHNVDIYYCKICKLVTENKDDYEEHLTTHIGEHQCTECNAVYRKHESLISHLQWHERSKEVEAAKTENGNICETCGVVLENEAALEEHCEEKHMKKYTCFYCGRMYKGQASFEAHIQKHEKHLKTNTKPQPHAKLEDKSNTKDGENQTKRSVCKICGKTFVDERSLLWHQRLHDNVRPYVCDICDRGFVSLNRRNQHAICAHTQPTRRCPLCPSLFHLKSMVNTHLKKVHLNKSQKRRNRIAKHQNVFWRTETVPIQDLSVSIQNEVLEMQTSNNWEDMKCTPAKQEIAYSLDMINEEFLMQMSDDPDSVALEPVHQ